MVRNSRAGRGVCYNSGCEGVRQQGAYRGTCGITGGGAYHTCTHAEFGMNGRSMRAPGGAGAQKVERE
jgi:hypothetical protein